MQVSARTATRVVVVVRGSGAGFKQLAHVWMGGQMEFGIEHARNLFWVLHPIGALRMVNGKQLRDTEILERVGLPRVTCVAGALVANDHSAAASKLGGKPREHRGVGFRAAHPHDRRTPSGSSVGDGCAVGFQPTHGASSRR